jgi:glycosyltransferase involved in cell wall biosynthesis
MGEGDELLLGLHDCLDSTREICKKITDPRLKISIHSGGSFSDVLNDLCARAQGDYIARMDSDDVCLPWRFWLQKRIINRQPDAFIFSSAIIGFPFLGGHLLIPQYTFSFNTREIYKLLVESNPLNHPTFVGSKKLITSLGGYHSVAGEDLDLWLRAALMDVKMLRSRAPLIIYRLSATQLSKEKGYSQGWKTSPQILANRAMLRTKVAKFSSMFGPLSVLKIGLQEMGLPTPKKLCIRFWQLFN